MKWALLRAYLWAKLLLLKLLGRVHTLNLAQALPSILPLSMPGLSFCHSLCHFYPCRWVWHLFLPVYSSPSRTCATCSRTVVGKQSIHTPIREGPTWDELQHSSITSWASGCEVTDNTYQMCPGTRLTFHKVTALKLSQCYKAGAPSSMQMKGLEFRDVISNRC